MSYYYYEVIGMDGNRICMCGTEDDARMMMLLGPNRRWVKCHFLKPDTVETTAEPVEEAVLPQRLDLPAGNDVVWNGPKAGFGFR